MMYTKESPKKEYPRTDFAFGTDSMAEVNGKRNLILNNLRRLTRKLRKDDDLNVRTDPESHLQTYSQWHILLPQR